MLLRWELRRWLPHDLLEKAIKIAVLGNPNNAYAELEMTNMQAAAQRLQLQLLILKAGTERDINAAYETLAHQGADALAVGK